MKLLVLAATAATAALLATSASASVFISFDGSTTAYSQVADEGFNFDAVCGPAGVNCGGFETLTIEGTAPLTRPGLLHSDTVSVNGANSGTASITVWVTRTGLTNLGDNFFSSFSTNNQAGPVNAHLETLIAPGTQLYGAGGTQLGFFNNNTIGSGSKNQFAFFDTGAGTYSVTERYTLTANGSASEISASPSITLATAAVPEPATWALMIAGFGGAGAMLRRRRSALAAG